jgi:C4-dicarboxylate transporter, DctM subunit
MSPLILFDALLLAGLLILGVPVPLCFAAAVLLLVLFGDYASANFLVGAGFNQLSSIVLVAIPLYILAGGIMAAGGIAGRLVDLADCIFGRLRGGLGMVAIVATAVFGAISGMASSAVAAIGRIMIPRMEERGYDRAYATALISSASVLALLIPPSASMIIYGWVTGTSILACFLATTGPACMLIILLSVWNRILTGRMPLRVPAPAPLRTIVTDTFTSARRAGAGMVMPMIILGFIYGGVTTPTEAAAVAVVYAVAISVYLYRDLDWTSLSTVIWQSAQIAGVLMIVIFFATMLGRLWTFEEVPQQIMAGMLAISSDPIMLLLLINLCLIIVGMFMEDVSGILLAAPLLLPVAVEAGVHPVQFAAIMGVNLGMGLITPPTAPILYFSALIGRVGLGGMLKPTLVFILFAYLPVVLVTTFMPAVSMWLPTVVLGL